MADLVHLAPQPGAHPEAPGRVHYLPTLPTEQHTSWSTCCFWPVVLAPVCLGYTVLGE